MVTSPSPVLRLLIPLAVVALLPGAVALSAPMSPRANLWVAPGGGSGCVRSPVPLSYARARTRNAVCDTADRAYHAAAGRDVVRVKNGKYPGFVFTAGRMKTRGAVVIEPETEYGVTLTSRTRLGEGVGYLTLGRFVVRARRRLRQQPERNVADVIIGGQPVNVGKRVDGRPAASSSSRTSTATGS